MDLNLNELKKEVRRSMQLTSPDYRLVAVFYLLLTTGVSLLFNLVAPTGEGTFSLFLSIALSLYSVIIEFGYTLWSLWTHRRLDPGADSLIQGFSVTGRVIYLQISIFTRLFFMMFGIIFICTFLTMLITENPFAGMIVALPTAYIAMYVLSLRYKFAPYLLADFPDLGPGVAIHRSVRLSRGWKMNWFKLDLSFLVWLLLAGLLEAGTFLLCASLTLDPSSLSVMDTQSVVNAVVSLSASTPVLLGTALVTLPLQIWLIPYRQVSFAALYDTRLKLAMQEGYSDPFGPLVPPV